jgi:hypothetical protein
MTRKALEKDVTDNATATRIRNHTRTEGKGQEHRVRKLKDEGGGCEQEITTICKIDGA